MERICYLVLLLLGCKFVSGQFDVVRDTIYGKVKGTAIPTIEQYLGVPYAAPPVGELRWRAPVSHPGWADSGEVWEANRTRSFCPQYDWTTSEINGDEDCLYLNVYVPRTPISEYFPVMVYIYGGGFSSGSSDTYDGSLIASINDVIVVAMNYRVGALGFMSTGDNQATGNYGILDQRAALQWVQENIENFGGDRNKVTIVGQSAGAASAILQGITPLNFGQPQLFHRIIAQSGSPFAWWSYQSDPRYHALQLMEAANCPTFSIALGLECLRNASFEDIVAIQVLMAQTIYLGVNEPWVPCIDGSFLTDVPDAMADSEELKSELNGRYEFLIGANNFDITYELIAIRTIQNEADFKEYVRGRMEQYFNDPDKIVDAISYNYIEAVDPPSTAMEWQLLSINVTRDYQFLAPALNISNIASSSQGFNSSTFSYLFTQIPGDVIANTLVNTGVVPREDPVLANGALHGEEVPYVFGMPLIFPNVTEEDRDLSLLVMTYWTNFAKTGNPSLGSPVPTEWPKYDPNTQEYLVLGTKEPEENLTSIRDHFESDKVVFWTRELEMYGEGKGLNDTIAVVPSNETSTTVPFEPIVTTNKGQVKGLRIVKDGYILDRFLRIPYAAPPVGMLRFKSPEPHSGWRGVLDASGNVSLLESRNGCAYAAFGRDSTWGKEDCLFVNVWVPGGINATRDRLLPVIVWIHGGAFMVGRSTGAGFVYDLGRLANHGQVIGVSLNYRLGPLGFLSTLDENAPGNAGFLDQVAALQWIQDNIAAFGGDSQKVTMFGQSAGGASVSYHMISPLSRNLFQRGISDSGSTPAQWTIAKDPLEWARKLAEVVDCPTHSNKLLVRCLQNKPVEKIAKGGLFSRVDGVKDTPWAAVVDGHFMVEDPWKILGSSADKDYLLGHNSMDGFMMGLRDFPTLLVDNVPMSRDDIVYASKRFAQGVPDHVAEAVAFKYIDWNEPESGLVWPKMALVDFYTDTSFASPTYWNANERLAANGAGQTFMYRFNEKAGLRVYPEWMGADHTAELIYVLGHALEGWNFTDADRALSLAMMTHWTNFAWTGNPNYPNQGDIYAEWPEYTLDTKYAFEFNTSTATMPEKYPHLLTNYRGEFVEFWTEMMKDLWTLPLDVCPTSQTKISSERESLKTSRKAQSRAVTCVDEPLVRVTESGCVRGYEYESNNKTIERYLGIPYAKPPLESLRFQPPQAPEPWSDVYQATNYSKICPQSTGMDDTMNEDCLYMCIYVPQVNVTADTTNGLPVMVWLHGGAFMFGNGMEKLKGDTLASLGDVIVINLNYRLGSFGFMTTDDAVSAGNYGLLDQQMALNWVKNNIAKFGGNPDEITIFGNSAGGQGVLLHSLSPTNQDLGINKAIIESAGILPHDDLKQRDRAVSLANAASCPTNTGNQAMVECLRGLSVADLLAAQVATGLSFGPTIDGDFLPTHPRELAVASRVRNWKYIIGANDGDGSVMWGDVQTVDGKERFHEVVDKQMEPLYSWRTALIEQHYADYDDMNFFNDEQKMQIHLTQLFGDERYLTPALEVAEDHTDYGADVFFYYFTYPHDRPDFYGFPAWAGSAHSAEFSFVWGDVINDETQSEEVKDLSRRIIEYWSNFAKTGNPNTGYDHEPAPSTEWSSYRGNIPITVAKNYIQLDLGNKTQVLQDLKPTEKAFWLEHMVAEARYCEVEPITVTTTAPPTIDFDTPEVMTSGGPVRGKRIKNELFDVNVFLGIPYAKPPVGQLRFANAEAANVWTSVLDATVPKPPCMQATRDGNVVGDEDCLYLDIFMPSGLVNTNSASMPVLFWIHGDADGHDSSKLGGSFWSGGGSPDWKLTTSTLDPSYLASMGNVVVIRPNFRLGALGFFTTQSEAIRGNYGLSDLRQAIMWASENAQNFAGDLKKLMLIGQGSGGAAAELLSIIPSTKGYVKSVVSLSGSAYAPWAFCSNYECMNTANPILDKNGCSGAINDAESLICLRGRDAENIVRAVTFEPVTPDVDSVSNAWGTWRFNIDGDIIPDVTLNELSSMSKADFITGTTSHEFYDYLKIAYSGSLARTQPSGFLQTAIRDTYRFLMGSNMERLSPEAYTILTHEYTNWEDRSDEELAFESTVQYYTDLMFAVDSSRGIEAKLKSRIGELYQLVITRALKRSTNTSLHSWVGGRHGDDVTYTFGLPFLRASEYSDDDREFSTALMSYWINFAWNEDPNNAFSSQNWEKYTQDRKAFLKMTSDIALPGTPTDFNLEKNNLWSDVVPLFEPVAIERTTTSAGFTTTIPTTTEPSCIEEIPPIGEGLGLSLTPSGADTAIYAMFSVCLILGVILISFISFWVINGRNLKSKNGKMKEEDSLHVNGTFEHDNGGE